MTRQTEMTPLPMTLVLELNRLPLGPTPLP